MRYNVRVKGRRTSATLNPSLIILLMETSELSIQQLIDAEEKKGGSNGDLTTSAWIARLIVDEALQTVQSMKKQLNK